MVYVALVFALLSTCVTVAIASALYFAPRPIGTADFDRLRTSILTESLTNAEFEGKIAALDSKVKTLTSTVGGIKSKQSRNRQDELLLELVRRNRPGTVDNETPIHEIERETDF